MRDHDHRSTHRRARPGAVAHALEVSPIRPKGVVRDELDPRPWWRAARRRLGWSRERLSCGSQHQLQIRDIQPSLELVARLPQETGWCEAKALMQRDAVRFVR